MSERRWRGLGPGVIVAAAFIGPGTVTTATLAGARHGSTLLWALAFATIATMVLQEMSARLGLVTRAGLGSALRETGGPPWIGLTLAGLAVAAVVVGAAAYEAGNLTGAGLGLEGITGVPAKTWALLGAAIAAAILWTGRYKLLERVLMGCVAVMGLVFLATALLVVPRVPGLIQGTFIPRLPDGATFTALGLVGTTIVPYNLFLHAAAVSERWSGREALISARIDLVIAIGLGGIVSAAIVVTAAAALDGRQITSAADMASQLEPLLGPWAGKAFTLGLAAAGISSAITAPLAAAYATLDVMGRGRHIASPIGRSVLGFTLATGAIIALLGTRPVPLILLAQVLNGLVLPIIAFALLIAMNDRKRLGDDVNGPISNTTGGIVALLCLALGVRALMTAF
ncbi:MAG TPA: Nramp family divalent metal transporter [Gemmatimonadales bacterium]